MDKTPFFNGSNRWVHRDGVSIAPGTVRDVPISPAVFADLEPPDPADLNGDYLKGLLRGRVADIRKALGELEDLDLVRMMRMEEDGQGRKSLIEAIHDEHLSRAAREVSAIDGD